MRKDGREDHLVGTYSAGYGGDNAEAIVEALGGYLLPIYRPEDAEKAPIDRLLLLGGTDINPALYGRENEGHCYPPDARRDAVELALARRAARERIPTMGICRGHQMLAVAHGGTLLQDVPSAGKGRYHSCAEHVVIPEKNFHLPSVVVNSLHHQAVEKVPDGFTALAWSADGVIECIWSKEALAIGYQWHPEMLSESKPKWLAVFQWWYGGFKVTAPIARVNWYMPYIWRKKQDTKDKSEDKNGPVTTHYSQEYLAELQEKMDRDWERRAGKCSRPECIGDDCMIYLDCRDSQRIAGAWKGKTCTE